MNLYEQYIKNKFDLSAFGIERGESRSDYFCTPKGAKIIGWTGADDPTSVIVGVPRTAQGEQTKLHAACSALTFEPQKKVKWKMTFREKTVEDFEIQLKTC